MCDRVEGRDCGDAVGEWLSSVLQLRGLRLLQQSQRQHSPTSQGDGPGKCCQIIHIYTNLSNIITSSLTFVSHLLSPIQFMFVWRWNQNLWQILQVLTLFTGDALSLANEAQYLLINRASCRALLQAQSNCSESLGLFHMLLISVKILYTVSIGNNVFFRA